MSSGKQGGSPVARCSPRPGSKEIAKSPSRTAALPGGCAAAASWSGRGGSQSQEVEHAAGSCSQQTVGWVVSWWKECGAVPCRLRAKMFAAAAGPLRKKGPQRQEGRDPNQGGSLSRPFMQAPDGSLVSWLAKRQGGGNCAVVACKQRELLQPQAGQGG